MNKARVGRIVRALRRRRGWRQLDVGLRAGVSPSTISRIERADFGSMPLDVLERVAATLGASVEMVIRWQGGEALDRLLDEAHASLVDAGVRLYAAAGWELAVEVSFAIAGERGSIDLMAFHAEARLVAVNEMKSVVPDAQATVHGVDRKARLALRIAAERGWRADRVLRLLVVSDDRTSRRRVARHGALFEAAFPVRGRAARAWIRDPVRMLETTAPGSGPLSALLFLASVHRVNAGGARGGRHRIHRTPGRAA